MKKKIRKTTRKRERRGFLYRKKTPGGRKVIKRRRKLGRKI